MVLLFRAYKLVNPQTNALMLPRVEKDSKHPLSWQAGPFSAVEGASRFGGVKG